MCGALRLTTSLSGELRHPLSAPTRAPAARFREIIRSGAHVPTVVGYKRGDASVTSTGAGGLAAPLGSLSMGGGGRGLGAIREGARGRSAGAPATRSLVTMYHDKTDFGNLATLKLLAPWSSNWPISLRRHGPLLRSRGCRPS
jgi:hypothetical protein